MKKSSISYWSFFADRPTGGEWQDIPTQLKEFLESPECPLYSITNWLEQDKEYQIEISFKQIEKKKAK